MIKRLSSQAVPEDIQNNLDLFFSDLQEIGISYVGHGIVSDQGHHTGYFSDKKWGKKYIENQYFFNEPILANYDEYKNNLIPWGKIREDQPVAHMRREHTQINSGVTICQKTNDFNTFFNIGFKGDIDLFEFVFFKRDVVLSYFDIFNDYHLIWREEKKL